MRELKKITLLLVLASIPWALIAAVACGTPSDTGKVVTESDAEDTGELDEGPPCEGLGGVIVGSNNHLNAGQCFCDEGFDWCDATSLDCCPE